MRLKTKPSLGDYVDVAHYQQSDDDQDGPSFDENFHSLQLQQQKIVIRSAQQQRIFNELKRLLKRIFTPIQMQRDDKILKKLKILKQQAIGFNFTSTINLIHLAIGKRIVIIQIQKKQKFGSFGINKKVDSLFDLRFLKLQNVKFHQLQIQKLQKKIFIFEPFVTGNGFNYESCIYKSFHSYTLNKINAKNILDQINKVWYQSYDLIRVPKFTFIQTPISIIATIFMIILIIASAMAFFFDQKLIPSTLLVQIQLNVIGIVTPILVFLFLIIVALQVIDPITDQSQDRLVHNRIRNIIDEKNNQLSDFKHKWILQKQLLWIQLKIQGKIIQQQMGFQPFTTMCTQKILNGKIQIAHSIFVPKVSNNHLYNY